MTEAGEPAIEVLFDATAGDGEPGTDAERHYGGPLLLEGGSPHVFANFVSTLDGVVALGLGDGTDSSRISGRHPADRFMLGLLRAVADIVLIGAGTLEASPGHLWWCTTTAASWKDELLELRRSRGLPDPQPLLVVVSGSGRLPQHRALQPESGARLVTTPAGAERLARTHPGVTPVVAGDAPFSGAAIVEAVRQATGARWILCEGGPTLFGSLVAGGAAHELFLSVSALLAGRDPAHPRPGLIAGAAASASALHHAELRSVRRSGDLLLLRHRLG
jgi:riboflavin biosynthesis pyrimidine reductase